MPERKSLAIGVAVLVGLLVLANFEVRWKSERDKPAPEESGAGLRFKGYACTTDCSGHEAGYAWAKQNGLMTRQRCGASSQSFMEGCFAYVDGR